MQQYPMSATRSELLSSWNESRMRHGHPSSSETGSSSSSSELQTRVDNRVFEPTYEPIYTLGMPATEGNGISISELFSDCRHLWAGTGQSYQPNPSFEHGISSQESVKLSIPEVCLPHSEAFSTVFGIPLPSRMQNLIVAPKSEVDAWNYYYHTEEPDVQPYVAGLTCVPGVDLMWDEGLALSIPLI
ncbi:hypothetical protein AX17_002175 [Amanita inopinata Kibby_2008]|nr:hypothetical protein AX17_002175 [Amanita inopinata Kibby_2008]